MLGIFLILCPLTFQKDHILGQSKNEIEHQQRGTGRNLLGTRTRRIATFYSLISHEW
jgi:hypothetical protein